MGLIAIAREFVPICPAAEKLSAVSAFLFAGKAVRVVLAADGQSDSVPGRRDDREGPDFYVGLVDGIWISGDASVCACQGR